MTTQPLLLAISTSSPALSIALVAGDVVLARRHEVIGRGHAEALVPAIANLLTGHALPHAVLVDIGPGSYTGIRIGIAAARALGLAWQVPVHGISGLSLVAAQAFAAERQLDAVLAVIDAGRGQAAGAAVLRGGVAAPAAVLAVAPAGIAAAGAGVQLLTDAPPSVHDCHPDAGFAGLVPEEIWGQPTALYLGD
ncbi:tRNA (adenosine(37)-N6)-threonylcarbamoyltransferase complex dimerization subunit type 1 TsaB [Sandarakinorhabdus sp.]|uniref:tRNA (adenosine(37)-N6)-threonylcarbamoyltransferase complex dimerization subunit type 1 TsaB n=1 Tax=Sandarakinorhabdus sp. TaxID=1916663 RepID=UPI00334277FA